LEGARNGACLMVGGEENVFKKLILLFSKLAGIEGSFNYFGHSGAGHFVKMVHNGIEYGMLESIGEGFEILFRGPYKLDLRKITASFKKGSVVRGWLMDLLTRAIEKDPQLQSYKGSIGGGETGSWTVSTAEELDVDVPLINGAVKARKKSIEKPSFSGKVIEALRGQFGGHK
jgi:6-phosphogluconate dehydrogenase